MARKESITKTMLLEAAFELVKDEGIENLTARKLAAKAGCSTQPIFRTYKNMEEVTEEVFQTAMDYYNAYCKNYKKGSSVPFADLGMAYISFARENKNLNFLPKSTASAIVVVDKRKKICYILL